MVVRGISRQSRTQPGGVAATTCLDNPRCRSCDANSADCRCPTSQLTIPGTVCAASLSASACIKNASASACSSSRLPMSAAACALQGTQVSPGTQLDCLSVRPAPDHDSVCALVRALRLKQDWLRERPHAPRTSNAAVCTRSKTLPCLQVQRRAGRSLTGIHTRNARRAAATAGDTRLRRTRPCRRPGRVSLARLQRDRCSVPEAERTHEPKGAFII